jgi:hypothetical protein
MPRCPSCSTDYVVGEFLCPNCHMDLSPIEISGPTESSEGAVGVQYYCDPSQTIEGFPGCGCLGAFEEEGHKCPDCGAYWENPIPASTGASPLQAQAQTPSSTAIQAPPPTLTSAASPVPAPQPTLHLSVPPAAPGPHLVVEGNQTVTWLNNEVTTIPFDTDEISIGCRDINMGHYPDIDLMRFRRNDPYLSRRIGSFVRERDRYYIEVLSEAQSTTINGTENLIETGPQHRRELKSGDRVFLSDSIVIRFEV